MKKFFYTILILTCASQASEQGEQNKLLQAVLDNDCDTVKTLLFDEDLSQKTQSVVPGGLFIYPLHQAVLNDSECIVHALLEAPFADEMLVASQFSHGFIENYISTIPLALAVEKNNHKIAQLLLDAMRRYEIHPSYVHRLINRAKDDRMRKMLLDY